MINKYVYILIQLKCIVNKFADKKMYNKYLNNNFEYMNHIFFK